MKNYFKYIAVLALGIVSCEPEFENSIEEEGFYSNGEADFSNYVALGNSLTAGYADGSLYRTGQQNSYPNILAKQFSLVQDNQEFTQPLVNDNAGGLVLGGQTVPGFDTRLVLAFDAEGNPSPQRYRGSQPTTEVGAKLEGSYSNMGVPGAKSYHLAFPHYGDLSGLTTQPATANPYFVRFASSPGTTVVQDALAQEPTFFSLWIGNNDVLGFATSGGTGVDQTGTFTGANPMEYFSTYGQNDITDPNAFAAVYGQMVQALAASTSGGVLINIPDVASVPYFTTVPVDAIPLDAQTAAALNAQFAAYNDQILPGLMQIGLLTAEEVQARRINFTEGDNFVTLADESLTDISQIIQGAPFNLDPQTAGLLGQLRQATVGDLIPLPALGFLGTTVGDDPMMVNGVSVPLGDQYVLTTSEQEMIAAATASYNQTIAALAQTNGLGLVDANAMLTRLANEGIAFDAGTVTSEFVTGGAFSLDGIHLTPRGYAIIANGIIDEVNETYNSEVPKVNVGGYNTVTLSNDVQ
ncbi:G-D-S-L family lipolytic protein [Salegentibacter sp. F188]|uniref:G-D-S-L family lipolytic protein n=1 Tax=Autumnicola patrickiae TaxID=3075591 RepID=A0ABU3E048_9FLAO|nr:G-D-S-L family lipolytic protein [Salegentibacter sp. F188]MDT0689331.1 G-D-S-L family lipolytic protein [Salegentibacter sp. F188]